MLKQILKEILWTNYRVLSNAYADFAQLVPDAHKSEDGWVRFEFVEVENRKSNEWKEVVLQKLPPIVEQMQDNGYNLSDIAILVRDKKDARLIADYFLEYQKKSGGKYRYDILSGDSLLLKNAEIVKWLVACFKYIIDSSDSENTAFLCTSIIYIYLM
jgi:superfamily I DNA/RNA helicase